MATPRYNRARDFGLLLKNLSSFSNNQARVVTYDEDQLNWVDVEIRPNGGIYKGGTFFFKLTLCEKFPIKAPKVKSISPIYHPNIDVHSQDVCLNLWGEWSPSFGLQDAIQGLLFLMYEPNLDSMLAGYIHEDTFHDDLESAMEGNLDIKEGDEEQLEIFNTGNTKDVKVFYEKLAAAKNIDGGAAAAEAAVPLADVFSKHVTAVLDTARMNIKLKTVDIPHSSMIPSKFHSRQLHKLRKSSSIHGRLFRPDIEDLIAHSPPQKPTPRHTLKRSVTVLDHEHIAYSKPLDLSDPLGLNGIEAMEPLYISGLWNESQAVSEWNGASVEGSNQTKAIPLSGNNPREGSSLRCDII